MSDMDERMMDSRESAVVTNYLPRTGAWVCWGVVDGAVECAFVVHRRRKRSNQWGLPGLPKPQPDGGKTYA